MITKRKPWKKNLYENKCYPDNHTDKTFLEELRKNVHVKDCTLYEAISGAGRISQEFCSCVAFTLIFVFLYNGWIEPEHILFQTSILTLFGYIIYRVFINSEHLKIALIEDFKTVTIFLVFGFILSPVLHNLTDSISTDTIYATTAFMMAIHLIFFDYGISAAIVSSALSLNAAIFGSICLASRLSSPYHAFVLLTIAVECYALMPSLLSKLKSNAILVTYAILTTIVLYTVSFTLMVLFISVLIFVNILCPYWFLAWHRHKDNIYGPWDEAIVHDSDSMDELINSNA